MTKIAASSEMNRYFKRLQDEANRCYEVATAAREKGFDPETRVEIPQAEDLASRVEQLLQIPGIAAIIREVAKTHNREEMSIIVAKKVAKDFQGPKNVALDRAVRVGLAVLTEGILWRRLMASARSRYMEPAMKATLQYHSLAPYDPRGALARQ